MGMDEAIMEAYAAGQAPPTIRFYGWQPAAVSLGYFQHESIYFYTPKVYTFELESIYFFKYSSITSISMIYHSRKERSHPGMAYVFFG